MTLEERLAPFDLLDVPVWVFDAARATMIWANTSALELWRAESRDALCKRDFSDMSDAIRTRLREILAKLVEGQTVYEQFTFYPRGAPVSVHCHLSGIRLDDGTMAMLAHARPDAKVDPGLVRGIEAVRHTSAIIALLGPTGAFLMQNPAALRTFDAQLSFDGWFDDAKAAPGILAAVDAGRVFSAELLACTRQGPRWHTVEARGTRDPVTATDAILVQMMDVTVQREMAWALERQQRQLQKLAVPIMNLGDSTLVLPLVGALDRERGAMIAERLLPTIVARRAREIILDLTGLEEIDAESVEHLVRIVQAISLLGARPVLTGIQAEISKEMVNLDVHLPGVQILRDLHDAVTDVHHRARRTRARR